MPQVRTILVRTTRAGRSLKVATARSGRIAVVNLRTGPQGQPGQPGEIGAPGASAYSVYLATTGDDPVLSEAVWAASRASILAAGISDSTALGRSLITAATASAARTELGAGATGASLFEAASASAANNILGQSDVILNHPATLGTNWTHSGGGVYVSGVGNATGYQDIRWSGLSLENGATYLLRFEVSARTSGFLGPGLGNSGSGSGGHTRLHPYTTGSVVAWMVSFMTKNPSDIGQLLIRCENGFVGTIQNISLKKLSF